MHLLRQQRKPELFGLFFIFITQTISLPVHETVQSIRCNILHQNCTFIQGNSLVSPDPSSSPPPPNPQGQAIRQSTNSQPTLTTTRQRSTTKASGVSDFDSFSDNLKRAALILAGIALGLVILRICFMLCKSRSSNSPLSNRHSSTVRPQVATVDQHQFKPDSPPVYAEAIANMEHDGGKLPSYDELPSEQRQHQQQRVYNNNGFVSTQM